MTFPLAVDKSTAYEVMMVVEHPGGVTSFSGFVVCAGYADAVDIALEHFPTPPHSTSKKVLNVRQLDVPTFVARAAKPH